MFKSWDFCPHKSRRLETLGSKLKFFSGLNLFCTNMLHREIIYWLLTFIRSRRDHANKHYFHKLRWIRDNTVVHLDSCLWPSGGCQDQFFYFSCACVCQLLREISGSLAAKCCTVFTSQPLTCVHLCLVFHFCETRRPWRCHSVVFPLVLKRGTI